ncbi:MAG: signal peptide peptidase SppA [Candidatus Palauibacterales bacterium]|nr:signal peptide peptidase SppA [Candidatus Palauibacterales bacterium]
MQRRTTVLSIALILAFFAIGAGVVVRLSLGGQVPLFSADRVAILPVLGVLESDAAFLANLEAFRDDESVRGFVIEIRSPGGVAGTAQSMYAALARLRDEDDRPVVAWIGEVGASGGYYVALGADSILALPSAVTGSIGVIMEFPNAEELLRKAGVGLEVVKRGDLKGLGSPTRDLREDERQVLQQLVDDVYEQFVSAVSENRGMDRESVTALADGRVLSGQRAAELGLVDRTATLREAVDLAGEMAGLGDNPNVVRPTERRLGFWDVVRGVEETRLLSLVRSILDRSLVGPRLRYQWP